MPNLLALTLACFSLAFVRTVGHMNPVLLDILIHCSGLWNLRHLLIPAQDFPFTLILWFVAKTIYLS